MILMYHKVHPDTPSIWWVTVNDFYRQMSELKNRKVVYLDEYDSSDPDQVVITFDGIYKNVVEYALPILKHFNFPFELFITSDYIGKDNSFDTVEPLAIFTDIDDLKNLVRNGGRLQWHTKSHINLKNVFEQNIIDHELLISKDFLLIDPSGFKWFAYPHGEYNDYVIDKVKKIFAGAVSCDQGDINDRFILPRITVTSDISFRNEKLTCIIASYNYGRYLSEAIESVLRQTVRPDFIIISDDCSDDETYDVANYYLSKYPELIKYNRNSKNLGIVEHFNKALDLTETELVFILGADNRLASNYIEEILYLIEKKTDVGIVYTDYILFGNRSKIIANTDQFKLYQKEIISENNFKIIFPKFNNHKDTLDFMINRSNFIHGSSLFRKSAFRKVGGYKSTDMPEDYNLFTRILKSGFKAIKAEKTFLEYRQHSENQANNIVLIYNQLKIYRNLYNESKLKENYYISKIESFKFVEKYLKSFLFRVSFFIYRFFYYLLNKIKN